MYGKKIEHVLILGSSGYLGSTLAHHLKGYKLYRASSKDPKADLFLTPEGTISFRREIPQIDAVIVTAALTSIQACQENPKTARWINEQRNYLLLEQLASQFSFFPLFLSSDAVFSGKTSDPLWEHTPPDPISVYGQTKYEAEQMIQRYFSSYSILRLTKLWGGEHPKCLRKDLLDRLQRGDRIQALLDQYMRPLHIADAIESIDYVLKRPKTSIVHLAGPKLQSWYEICQIIAPDFSHQIEPVIYAQKYADSIRPQFLNLASSLDWPGSFCRRCIHP